MYLNEGFANQVSVSSRARNMKCLVLAFVFLAPYVLGGGHGGGYGGGFGGGFGGGHGGGAVALGGDGNAFSGGYSYHGPLAQPVVLKSGYLADTKAVAAAKNAHLGALSQAAARGGHGYH